MEINRNVLEFERQALVQQRLCAELQLKRVLDHRKKLDAEYDKAVEENDTQHDDSLNLIEAISGGQRVIDHLIAKLEEPDCDQQDCKDTKNEKEEGV